jgi:hypothetical protein
MNINKYKRQLGQLRVADIIDDPINDNLNVILFGAGKQLNVVTLDRNYVVRKIQAFIAWPWVEEGHAWNKNFVFLKGQPVKKYVGETPKEYKKNALDYAISLKENSFITIVNYLDYQLLFTDNNTTGKTKVYKITR